MSIKQTTYRYRIYFTKQGPIRYIGHLDLQKVFQQSINRAKLPVVYSEGFNPHQLLSFAAPLPLGMAGKEEIAEIYLHIKLLPQEIAHSLNKSMPAGIEVLSVKEIPPLGKGAAATVYAAVYYIQFPAVVDMKEIIQDIMAADVIEIEKKTKKGIGRADIRTDILEMTYSAENGHTCLAAKLSTGSDRNLKPQLLMEYIHNTYALGFSLEDVSYERLKILLKGEGI